MENYNQRIDSTAAARQLIETLKKHHGDLMFHQSGGCCDGSSPMCFPNGEFKTGPSDIWLGNIEDCPFFMSADQFEYWNHTHLTLDVVPGRGASFSIEIPYGLRFLIVSRLFTTDELKNLQPIMRGDAF